MNNAKKFFFILLILISSSIFAKTSVVFVNGITTTPDGAQKNLHSLWWRYCVTSRLDCSSLEFKNFYNPTQGFYKDGIELTIQAQAEKWAIDKANQKVASILPKSYNNNPSLYIIGTDEYNYFQAYLAFYLSNIYYEQQLNNSGIWADSSILGSNQNIALADSVSAFRTIAAQVIKELSLDNETRKVVLVPHSQGNYFAQAVSSFLQVKYPDGWKRFYVHGVASVSSVAQLKTEHTTHSQDQALLSHAVLNEFDRKPNFDAGWSLGATAAGDNFLQKHPDDVTNHGFFEVYMGFKKLLLPVDGISCVISFVPTENAMNQREAYRIKTGNVCQPKNDVQNDAQAGKVLIGVGSQFSDLRGTSLPNYIISKVYSVVQFLNPPTSSITVSPLTTTISKDITFTVTGQNLQTGMGFSVEDCLPSNNELPGGTVIQKQFRCTINSVPGVKKGVLKDKPGGTITLLNFSVNAQLGQTVSSWISAITPPGYVVKQIINTDLASLPNGAFAATGDYKINYDNINCNLSQTLAISGVRTGNQYSIVSTYTSPQTTCSDGSHTAVVGYKETYTGTLNSGIINLTNSGACSFLLSSQCYNYSTISPQP